jgi:hypothetical protein
MTVYVDNSRRFARVGRVAARWSHLTADTPAELHEFAARIGLRREWFQTCKSPLCTPPCPRWHYDVTESKRAAALAAGAQEISWRDLGRLILARRKAGGES